MSQTAAGRAELEAARLLLERMGISPAELLDVRPARPPAPTFAEYVPVVAAAVSPGTRRAYGSYWNRVVQAWGERRIDEPRATNHGSADDSSSNCDAAGSTGLGRCGRCGSFPACRSGGVGLFVRMHHAVADGIAGVATIGTFLDATPNTPPASAPPWTPASMPTAGELLADNLRRHADEVGRAFSILTRPLPTVRRVQAAWPAMRGAFADVPTPSTSLDRRVGPDRNISARFRRERRGLGQGFQWGARPVRATTRSIRGLSDRTGTSGA